MPDPDLLTVDAQTGALVPVPAALTLAEAPFATLQAAQQAATALQDVIRRKAKPVIFGGEQYLEFEDWMTCARFYGITAKVVSVTPESDGFHAVAVAITADGREISRAEAWCLRDEANWQTKPTFQLASMAQTRACAKSLRNVLSWVVVLAGYRGTPAEEMNGGPAVERPARLVKPRGKREPKPEAVPIERPGGPVITKAQQNHFIGLAARHGWPAAEAQALLQRAGIAHSSLIKPEQYADLCAALEQGPPAQALDEVMEGEPF